MAVVIMFNMRSGSSLSIVLSLMSLNETRLMCHASDIERHEITHCLK